MASNARLFVDFFGTLHARVDAIRGNRVMLSRQRMPYVVLLASVAGVSMGQALMDYVYDRVQQENQRDIQGATTTPRRYTIMMKPRRELLLPYHMPGTSAHLPHEDRRELSLWTAVE